MKLRIENFFCILSLITLTTILFTACGGSFADKINNHKAASWFEEGIITRRFAEMALTDNGDRLYSVIYNVNTDMTEEDMMAVLEYDEMVHNSESDEVTGKIIGERDNDYYCYSIFCEGSSMNIIGQYKYVNYKSVEYTEEDKYNFLNPLFERRYE